jgi:hypothetical protein
MKWQYCRESSLTGGGGGGGVCGIVCFGEFGVFLQQKHLLKKFDTFLSSLGAILGTFSPMS